MKRHMLLASTLLCPLLSASASLAGDEWTERVKLKGDLRYRHEYFDVEGETRTRQRFRARLGVQGEVSDEAKIVLQVASGSDDPVSTNQTLGDGFSSKNIVIDLAYFEVKPGGVPGLAIIAGKSKMQFVKPATSELLWDPDLNPEGVSGRLTLQSGDTSLELIGGGYWVEERSSAEDTYLAGAQSAFRQALPDQQAHLAAGVGYFHYGNTAGTSPLAGEAFGNSLLSADGEEACAGDEGDCVYEFEYELIEVFGEAGYRIEEMPVVLFGDLVVNQDPDDENLGWLAGVRLGTTKRPGSWDARYIYRRVESDATYGLFNDSDFIGGGTDGKGHEVGAGIQASQGVKFSVTYFNNQRGLEDGEDFHRLQVDAQLKF